MASGFKIKGLQQAQKNLRNIAAKFPKKVKKALVKRAELIMTDSKENYCPVEFGTLKNSGHVAVDPDKIAVTLGYGGAAEDYAVVQHENLTFKHEVGEAKYLEKPLFSAMETFEKDLADDCRVTKADTQ